MGQVSVELEQMGLLYLNLKLSHLRRKQKLVADAPPAKDLTDLRRRCQALPWGQIEANLTQHHQCPIWLLTQIRTTPPGLLRVLHHLQHRSLAFSNTFVLPLLPLVLLLVRVVHHDTRLEDEAKHDAENDHVDRFKAFGQRVRALMRRLGDNRLGEDGLGQSLRNSCVGHDVDKQAHEPQDHNLLGKRLHHLHELPLALGFQLLHKPVLR
mmetsp:Transcript_50340/g.132606  ORF Transcript_50340/g.132606 Transcript_50340/m.132606 type:complete len:210 (+) Transcript_50340:1588-2217(+)